MRETYWANEPDLEELHRLYTLLTTDPKAALIGLEQLSGRQSMMSMWYLADAYYMGSYAPQDIDKAKYWYDQADKAGSMESAYMLGRICARQKKYNEALAAFSRSAAQGYSPAMYRLALMYRDGIEVKRDIARCRLLLEDATSRVNLFAKRDLATLYIKGAFGFKSIAYGFWLLATLVVDLACVIIRAIRHGPILDDRLLG